MVRFIGLVAMGRVLRRLECGSFLRLVVRVAAMGYMPEPVERVTKRISTLFF